MNQKKAQVTIFIIISLVVIAGVLIYLGLSRGGIEKRNIPEGGEDVYEFVISCSQQSLEEVILSLSLRGGYAFTPEKSNDFGIAYYSIEGENTMINKEELRDKISFYFDQQLEICINNFQNFSDREISTGEINSEINLQEEKVILDLIYPISISQAGETKLIEDFEVIEAPIRLGLIYDTSKEIIEQDIDNEGICLTCIERKISKANMSVNIIEYERDYIFSIQDNNSKINNNALGYSFAIKI